MISRCRRPLTWIPLVVVLVAFALPERDGAKTVSAQSSAGASTGATSAGYSLLRGAIDAHFHVDPDVSETETVDAVDLSMIRFARAQGIREFIIKNHYGTTEALAYLLRKDMPGLEAFGSIVLNRDQGGINLAKIEYMGTKIRGRSARMVWMPTYDSENSVRRSKTPDAPFVRVSLNGELLPEVKQAIALIARYNMALATGHLSSAEGLMVLREARQQGVRHLIVTHPMDGGVAMTEAQMKEAASLGAYLEFDFRNIFTGRTERPLRLAPIAGGRIEMIHRLGVQNVIIDEFWSKCCQEPREYGGPTELAAWVKAMNAQGFSNRDLDIMAKDNPAKLLELPVQ